MELPKINLSKSNGNSNGVFGGLKSRLGFASKDEPQNDYDDGYGDGYDDGYDDYNDGFNDFEDFGDEGFDEEAYDDGYGEPSSRYEPYAPVTTRSTGRSSYSSSPHLVTIDDVKANSSERLGHNPLPETRSTSSSSRVLIDNTMPAPSSPASASAQKERSEGLDSLFTPTAQATTSSYSAHRNVTVVRPMAYNDVERVASIVRAGDVAVLTLKLTPESLFSRVLDFSFGVASALEAQVDCVGTKVFAISKGSALTETEKASLRAQGII